jgi:hypothetical protein
MKMNLTKSRVGITSPGLLSTALAVMVGTGIISAWWIIASVVLILIAIGIESGD